MKEIIVKLAQTLVDNKANKFFKKQYKRYLHNLGIADNVVEGESDYCNKWSKFYRDVDIYSYRFFSHFCGNDPNIVPEAIGRRYIERILNPINMRRFYEDKNTYEMYMDCSYLPKTVLKRMGGV